MKFHLNVTLCHGEKTREKIVIHFKMSSVSWEKWCEIKGECSALEFDDCYDSISNEILKPMNHKIVCVLPTKKGEKSQ